MLNSHIFSGNWDTKHTGCAVDLPGLSPILLILAMLPTRQLVSNHSGATLSCAWDDQWQQRVLPSADR